MTRKTRISRIEANTKPDNRVFAVRDGDEQWVKLCDSQERIPLDEFNARYPNGVIFRFVYGDIGTINVNQSSPPDNGI